MQHNCDPFQGGIGHVCGGCKDNKACKGCACHKHYICNEKLLMEIAARLPADWEKLGIYLGVSKQVRDGIGGEKRNKVEAWGLDMFNKWWQNAKRESRWSDLQNALTEVHRHDLIQFTKEFFRDHDVNPTNPDQHKMDKYFQKMAEQIPRDWKDIGIYLYLSLDDLNAIQMAGTSVSTNRRTYHVLEAWKNMPNVECGDLLKALEEMGRRDIIMYIEQEVRGYKRVCSLHRECQREREPQEGQLEQEQERQRLEREQQNIEQQQHQFPQPGYRPSNPPMVDVLPNQREEYMQQQRYAPQPGHGYRQDPPPTALNQGAGAYSVQQSESVSQSHVNVQATPDPSLASAEHEPRELPSQHLISTNVNSMQPFGSDPSIASSISTELTPRVANMHLDSHDGADGNISAPISANTFSEDMTAENTSENLSLYEVGNNPTPSQISAGVPSTSVSVEGVELQIQADLPL